MAGIRKLPGDRDLGWYTATGSLEGVTGPGRRVVEVLEVRRASDLDLSPLATFGDLQRLELERVTRVDLASLPPLPGLDLKLWGIRDTDLAPLGDRDDLRVLAIFNAVDCSVPSELRLPGGLESLALIADGDWVTGEWVKAVVEAVDWSRMMGLRDLELRVSSGPQVEIDLGFVRLLPNLTRLDLRNGILHGGPDPSPLEPPFAGLSKHLDWVRIDGWDPPRLQAELRAYLGAPADPTAEGPVVYQRYGPAPDLPAWSAFEDAGGWSVYGSLYDALDGAFGDTEYDALREVKRRVRRADRALFTRLEFDHESDGTGIWALEREDIAALLALLDISPPTPENHSL